MIGKTISHYRIVEQIGEGGMGVVYVAEDTLLGRRVAIKTLTAARGTANQHFRMRFLREAQAVSKLSHPHIATIYDYGEAEDGRPYIVMELVEGKTLGQLMKEESLTVPRTIQIVREVAEALSEAHHHGIIHRDIKPSNIAVNERGVVKVLDFGLAKQVAPPTSDGTGPVAYAPLRTQTREGIIVGTPLYLSPEQALGIEVDARSDLFSLGSVLYECIAGQPAFSGKSDIDICARVIRDDPPPPSEFNSNVPAKLDRLTLKALAKKPEARHQSADEFVTELDTAGTITSGFDKTIAKTTKAATNKGSTSPLATLSDVFGRPRLSLGYVIAAIVVVGLMAFVGWRLTRSKGHQSSQPVQLLYTQAVEAMHQGAFFRASKILEQVISDDDSFALAHARLAEAFTELDYSEKAKDQLLRAQELVPDISALTKIDALRWQAVTSVVKRDFPKAIEEYKALVFETPDAEKQFALVDLGRAYEKDDQPDKAVESYEEATRRDPRYAAVFLRLGVVYGRSQRSNDAFSAFDQAYKLFEMNSEIEGLAEVSLQRAVLLTQLGKVADAREQLLKALDKSTALDHHDKRIRVLLNLSNNFIITGEPSQAQQYSTSATALAIENKMENLTTQGLIDIGNAHFLKGNYGEAEKNFNEALRLAQVYKGGRSEARAYLSLGSLRNHQNDAEAARDFVNRALPFYQIGGYRKESAQAYAILGHALDQVGDYDTAIRTFQQQLDVAQKVGDQQQAAWTHEGLGVVLNHQQRYPEALTHFDQQYKILNSLGNKMLAAVAAMNRGTMLWQLGHYDDARKALEEARVIADDKANQNKELLAWVYVSTARMALSEGKNPKAIGDAGHALELAGAELKAIAIQAKSALGLALSASGQTADGLRYCEDAVSLARSLHDPLPLSHALLALAQAELKAHSNQVALNHAQEAQQRFQAAKQYEGEWRAWLLQALAIRGTKNADQEPGLDAHVREVLIKLRSQWGAEYYTTYSARGDIWDLRKRFGTTLLRD